MHCHWSPGQPGAGLYGVMDGKIMTQRVRRHRSTSLACCFRLTPPRPGLESSLTTLKSASAIVYVLGHFSFRPVKIQPTLPRKNGPRFYQIDMSLSSILPESRPFQPSHKQAQNLGSNKLIYHTYIKTRINAPLKSKSYQYRGRGVANIAQCQVVFI